MPPLLYVSCLSKHTGTKTSVGMFNWLHPAEGKPVCVNTDMRGRGGSGSVVCLSMCGLFVCESKVIGCLNNWKFFSCVVFPTDLLMDQVFYLLLCARSSVYVAHSTTQKKTLHPGLLCLSVSFEYLLLPVCSGQKQRSWCLGSGCGFRPSLLSTLFIPFNYKTVTSFNVSPGGAERR